MGQKVRPVIERRIQRYNQDEIHFNLMAVISDRKMHYEKKIAEIQTVMQDGDMETDDLLSNMSRLQAQLVEEESKRCATSWRTSAGNTTPCPSSWRCSKCWPTTGSSCRSTRRPSKGLSRGRSRGKRRRPEVLLTVTTISFI